MNHLLLGSNGYIGHATQKACAARGDQVFGLSRGAGAGNHPDCIPIRGDRQDCERVLEIVKNYEIDTIIDFRAMSLETTAPLVTALSATNTRYVLISSSDVYRNYGLLHKLETGAPDIGALEEHAPLRNVMYPYRTQATADAAVPDHWKHHYDKIPIEQFVISRHPNWTILRLPMVYGLGDKTARFDWALRPMLKGAPALKVPKLWLDWTTTYGFVDNVGAAIALAAGSDNARGEIFNIGDFDPMPHSAWITLLAKVTGWAGEVQVDDDPASPFAQALSGLDLRVPLTMSCQKLRSPLGFVPAVDLETALHFFVPHGFISPG
jgi:nucleoside-diphosphate-sugar epimerase